MSKLTLTDLVNLENEASAVASINANNAAIEAALENTLSRDGSSPNSMSANLDMNSFKILNLAAPTSSTDVMRLGDIPAGTKGAQGDAGPANTLSVGSVSTGAAGSSVAVTISGTSPSQTIDFTIPKGDKGDAGNSGGAWADFQNKGYTADLLVNSSLGTVINYTDTATPTATITDESGGKKIILSTASRHFSWKTVLSMSGKRNRATLVSVNSAASGTFGAGIGLTDGLGNYYGFIVQSNGRLYNDSFISGVRGGDGLITGVSGEIPTFSSGTTLLFKVVLNDDATGVLFIGVGTSTPNIGPFTFSVPSTAYNVICVEQMGSSTFTHSVVQETANPLIYEAARNEAASIAPTDKELFGASLFAQIVSLQYRDAPGTFGSIPYSASIFVDAFGNGLSTVLPRKRLFDSDPSVLVLYVSAATGSSSNSGLSKSAPLDKISTALKRSGTGKAIIRLDPSSEFTYDLGPLGVAPVNSYLQIESWTPETSVKVSTVIPNLSWSLAANDRYTTTIPGGSVTGVDRIFDRKSLTSEGDYKFVVPQASTAAVEASGGWYISGTTLSVKTYDARSPDSDLRVYASLSSPWHFQFTTPGSWVYMEDIDVEGNGGGTTGAINTAYGSSTTPSYLELNRCTARYSSRNGIGLNGSANLIAYRCVASSNYNDGFNIHAFSSSLSPNMFLVSCTGYDGNSGGDARTSTDGACNSFTSHDLNSKVILLNCSGKAINRPYHFINGSLVWAINCKGMAYGSVGYSVFCAGLSGDTNPSKMWLDGCVTQTPLVAGPKDIETAASSTVYTYRFTGAVGSNVGGSTVSSFTPTVGGGLTIPTLVT